MTDPTDPRIEAAVQANLELDQRVLFDRRALLIENTRLSDELVGLRAELQMAHEQQTEYANWANEHHHQMKDRAVKAEAEVAALQAQLAEVGAEVTDLRQQLATVTESRDEYARRVRANWQARLAALNEAADAIKTDRERPSQTPPERSWASGNRLAESIVRGLAAERGAVLRRTETVEECREFYGGGLGFQFICHRAKGHDGKHWRTETGQTGQTGKDDDQR